MFKVAVVGTGLIATRKHLPAWKRRRQQAQTVALCDVSAEAAARVAAQFGVQRSYTDLRELLEREKPDIVDICTPPKTHASLAVQALEHGAHLLIEKPMALTTEECDRIIAAAKAARRQVCVAHSDLFYPSFLRAYEAYRDGAVGQFRGMSIFLSTPVDYITAKPEHWAHKLPGGVIGETGPHIVYLTLAFMPEIMDVGILGTKQLPEFSWSPYEDYRIQLVGKQGVSTTILTYTTNHWGADVTVWGSTGILKIDLETQKVVRQARPKLSPSSLGWSALSEIGQMIGAVQRTGISHLTGGFENTHELLIRRLCESLARGEPMPVPAEQGREAVRVLKLLADQLEGAAA